MNLAEMLPALKELSPSDKLRVVQFLMVELAREENSATLAEGSYPVWTPVGAYEAAQTLMDLVKQREQAKDKHE
ncbi:MAG: hypothetical protein HND46_24005 [Chloroflexi bacterium]|nr:hypothetical protein [Chloroflexota bacterium]NOG66486.1 hypothetical protein [Chloroflexota bacterium]